MNELRQDVVRQSLLLAFISAVVLVVTMIQTKRIDTLERQVQFLAKATRAAHDEAKQAQRMESNPHYLPNPLVKK